MIIDKILIMINIPLVVLSDLGALAVVLDDDDLST